MPKKNENPPPKKCGTAIQESVEIGTEKMSVILKADIKRKLKEIGLESGDNVIVHTSLKSMGYVDYEPYSLVHLTEAGMHIGRDIAHRHIVIQEFFQHILQLEPNVSNDVACELEHVIPPDVIRRLGQFVLYLRSREDDWKNWQEDYKEIRLEHIQSNTDRDLVRNAPPMLAMRTQMMGQDELRKKYR